MAKGFLFITALFLNSLVLAHGDHSQQQEFSMESYLEKCGGKIYAKCDTAELNQVTIYEAARKVAMANNQKILLILGADWCPACRVLNDMLKTDEQRDLLFEKYVVVEINSEVDSGEDLRDLLDVHIMGYPQAAVVSPGATIAEDKPGNLFYPSRFNTVKSLVDFMIGKQKPQAPLSHYLDQISYLGSASVKLLKKPIEPDNGYGRSLFFADPHSDSEKLINYGFAALNVFHYADAFRAFWSADQQESSVYAKVGLVIAAIENDNTQGSKVAQGFLSDLMQMQDVSEREQAWIEFAKSYYAFVNPTDLLEGMEKVLSTDKALTQLETVDGQNPEVYSSIRWIVGEMDTAIYEKALVLQPDNVGAHHYIMHIYEKRNRILDARAKGVLIKDLAPQSAHAVHMYGHTLPQSGKWQEALDQFLIADKIHIAWAKKNGVPPEEDWHYKHNLDLTASVLLVGGEGDLAYEIWSKFAKEDITHYLKALQIYTAGITNDVQKQSKAVEFFQRLMDEYPSWRRNVYPLLLEVQVNKENQKELLNDFSMNADTGEFTELMYLVIRAESVQEQTNPKIVDYFVQKMTKGGFDGWSQSYLELLRLYAVADRTGKTLTVKMLMDLNKKINQGLLAD